MSRRKCKEITKKKVGGTRDALRYNTYIFIYIYTSVDPSLDSDETYVGTMQLWNCSKGWREQESNVKQFRQRKLSNKIAEQFRELFGESGFDWAWHIES